ncbi:MAG: toxin-antitoxin system HicB family antitoxin [Leptospirales bacterium]
MKNKASVLTIRVPSELKHKIERVADEQGVSINQLALYAFTKEIQEIETSEYFSQYRGATPKTKVFGDFDSVMNKVKSKEVPEWDKMATEKSHSKA